MRISKPVSYTHLDVYKRQVLESTSGEVLLDGKEVTSMGADYRNVLGYFCLLYTSRCV